MRSHCQGERTAETGGAAAALTQYPKLAWYDTVLLASRLPGYRAVCIKSP